MPAKSNFLWKTKTEQIALFVLHQMSVHRKAPLMSTHVQMHRYLRRQMDGTHSHNPATNKKKKMYKMYTATNMKGFAR